MSLGHGTTVHLPVLELSGKCLLSVIVGEEWGGEGDIPQYSGYGFPYRHYRQVTSGVLFYT